MTATSIRAVAGGVPPLLADEARAADLRRMKRFATGLLALVAAVYVVARLFDDVAGVDYVEAFAEAAMVGALADWFAVTALFRHPLGIPIPHTAIIPNRKDQIGASLGQFVETNFLTRELLEERLERAEVGRRLGDWLAHPANAAKASSAVADVVRGALDVLDDETISASIESMVEQKVRETSVSPLIGRTLEIGLEGQHHQQLLDSTLLSVASFLDENRTSLRARLQTESPWWIPEPIDDRIFAKIFDGAQRFLRDVAADRDHELRASVEQRLVALTDRLRDDPVMIAKGEELKEELLAHPAVREWIASLWGELKRTLLTATADPDSELRRRLTFALSRLGERVQRDPELQRKIDDWVTSAAVHVVENYRGEVSGMISSTVARWDAASTSRRLELQVGRDLQFIRINGTIVGGLAGVTIHLVDQLVFS